MRDQHAEEARGRQVKEEEMRAREDAIKNRDTDLEELEKSQAAEHSRLEEWGREEGDHRPAPGPVTTGCEEDDAESPPCKREKI